MILSLVVMLNEAYPIVILSGTCPIVTLNEVNNLDRRVLVNRYA